MSAQDPVMNIIPALTFDDIREYLNERVRNHFCPACSSNNWQILGDEAHLVAMVAISKNGGFSLPPPSIPLVAMCCQQCGYVRSHALGMIAAWKAGKAKG